MSGPEFAAFMLSLIVGYVIGAGAALAIGFPADLIALGGFGGCIAATVAFCVWIART